MAPRDRRTPTRTGDLRASDQEREQLASQLRDHYSAGRLTDDELASRVDEAYAARTVSQLQALTRDLPETQASPSLTRSAVSREVTRVGRGLRTSFRIHLTIYVLVNLMLVGIWAASGGGYFWPIWPLLGWGIGVGAHGAPILAGVGTRAPRTARRELEAPASLDEVAASVDAERPSLREAAAPDGTVTILFSDIEDSTVLNERLGDARWLNLLREHNRLIRQQIAAHGGFEVKVQGDGFMIAFPGVRRAVDCARDIQRVISSALGTHPNGPVRVRIGLHTGEALREQDDFYGKAVVLAARIAEQAEGGEILASSVVKALAESGGDIGFEDDRQVALKGITGTQHLYRVV
jgi:class 3 adenylate cyclase